MIISISFKGNETKIVKDEKKFGCYTAIIYMPFMGKPPTVYYANMFREDQTRFNTIIELISLNNLWVVV